METFARRGNGFRGEARRRRCRSLKGLKSVRVAGFTYLSEERERRWAGGGGTPFIPFSFSSPFHGRLCPLPSSATLSPSSSPSSHRSVFSGEAAAATSNQRNASADTPPASSLTGTYTRASVPSCSRPVCIRRVYVHEHRRGRTAGTADGQGTYPWAKGLR